VVEMEIQQMNPIKTKTQTINEMETETKLVEDNEGQVENPIEVNNCKLRKKRKKIIYSSLF
jgi:hypothetical protein